MQTKCDRCKGRGLVEGEDSGSVPCLVCFGRGTVESMEIPDKPCPTCSGLGSVDTPDGGFHECSSCDGTGQKNRRERWRIGDRVVVSESVLVAGEYEIPEGSILQCAPDESVMRERLVFALEEREGLIDYSKFLLVDEIEAIDYHRVIEVKKTVGGEQMTRRARRKRGIDLS